MTHVHSLNLLVQANQTQDLPHRVIFHHLRITALSTLLPSDRTLTITLDNTIHTLSPPRIGGLATSYHLHLYLNPHNRLPYLQHTCIGTDPTSYCLIVTTSLSKTDAGSSSSRRRPMLLTTSHVPDLVTTLTFPANSTQYQQSILTLVTHLLLAVTVITPRQSWKIIREKATHRHTLQLILATITLKRHHLVWYIVVNDPPATQTTHRLRTDKLSNKLKRRTVLTPKHRPPKRQSRTRS